QWIGRARWLRSAKKLRMLRRTWLVLEKSLGVSPRHPPGGLWEIDERERDARRQSEAELRGDLHGPREQGAERSRRGNPRSVQQRRPVRQAAQDLAERPVHR